MSDSLISVIVPVYNVEPYLDRCVESIVNQTYRNLEIILVDDGSPDNCPQMCDAWAEKDNRIKVIHKENGGLSDARNAGMAIATGELMGFVDSDDWIREDMYQLLLENMQENNSDISVCGVKMIWDDGSPERMLTREGCCVLEAEDAMRAVIKEDWLKQPVWYKLYKTELVKNIRFPVGKYHEDVFWTYQAVGAANRVAVIDQPCYFYFQHNGSIMQKSYSINRLDRLDAYIERLEFIERCLPTILSETIVIFCFHLLYAIQKTFQIEEKNEKKACFERLSYYRRFWHKYKSIGKPKGVKNSIWYYMACVSLDFTAYIRNLFGIGC